MSFPVVIYFNQACRTSRNVLGIALAAGNPSVMIEHKRERGTRPQFGARFATVGIKARQAFRCVRALWPLAKEDRQIILDAEGIHFV